MDGTGKHSHIYLIFLLLSSSHRWQTNTKPMKPARSLYGSAPPCDMKIYRKNSNPLPGKHQLQPKITRAKTHAYGTGTNKSSSYPNCSSNSNIMRLPQSNYHRHSVSNLITIKIKPNQAAMVPPTAPMGHNPHHLSSGNLLAMNNTNPARTSSLFDNGVLASTFDTVSHHHNGQRSCSIGSATYDNMPSLHCVRSSSSGADRTRNRPVGDATLGLEMLCMQVAQSGMN